MATSSALRVQKHRASLRHKGLKLVQIWVPDTQQKGFKRECTKQALLTKEEDERLEVYHMLEHTADFGGWM